MVLEQARVDIIRAFAATSLLDYVGNKYTHATKVLFGCAPGKWRRGKSFGKTGDTMRFRIIVASAVASVMVSIVGAHAAPPMDKHFYLPDATASKTVSVTKGGTPEAEIIVLTEAVAIKETGPKETVAKFGEVYAFSPTFIAVRRDSPTMLTFWNLQPDDEHDFMLAAPDSSCADASETGAADQDLLRVHVPQGRNFQFLLRGPSAGDERTDPGAAASVRIVKITG